MAGTNAQQAHARDVRGRTRVMGVVGRTLHFMPSWYCLGKIVVSS
jgi:hypothetical protein